MTRTLTIVALTLASLLLGGCLPTVHTIYTRDVAHYDEALLGTWAEDPKDKETWEFKKVRFLKRYTLTYRKKNDTGKFDARLVKIGDTLFLDLYPEEPELEDRPRIYKALVLPMHTFMRVKLDGQSLKLAMLEKDWLQDLLEKDPKALKHELIDGDDDEILITASTEELHKFLEEHATNEAAWDKPYALQLIKK